MLQSILVIKLSALGDFIIALGAMESIRKAHPDAHITLLTTKLFKDMAERSGYFNDVWLDSRPKLTQPLAWLKLRKLLNSRPFDRVYDLQYTDRTAHYSRLFKKRPEWNGVIKGSPLFYDNPNWKGMHAWDRHKGALKVAGIDAQMPNLSWMASDDISLIKPKDPYVLFIPGAAPQHPEKRWHANRFGALATKLVRDGYQVAALGTQTEAEVIADICKACSDVIDLSGKTSFYDIVALAHGAAGAVGNDTGPTHIVSVAGCPVVVIFNTQKSQPERSGPVGKVGIVAAEDMSDVSVDHVQKTFYELIEKTSAAA